MDENKETEIDVLREGEIQPFLQQTINLGGSIAIVIPARHCKYEGIEVGDHVKVYLKKVTKE